MLKFKKVDPREAERITLDIEIELFDEVPDREGAWLTAQIPGGEKWYLIKLNSDGTFERADDIPDNTVFKTDDRGRIIETLTN